MELDECEPVQGAISDEHGQRWVMGGDGGDGCGAGLLVHDGGKDLLGNEKAAKVLTLQG